MKKEFRTITYGGTKFGDGLMRLQLDTGHKLLVQKNIEVRANIDLETGEVSLFIEKEDLNKLKNDIKKNS